MTPTILKTVLISFFQALESNGIAYCVLRNYEDLPEYTANDVDILVSRRFYKQAGQLLYTVSQAAGLTLHLQVEHACLLMVFHAQDDLQCQCHIDLYADITWKGFAIVDPEKILASRVAYKGFCIPAPAWEQAVNLLVPLLYHGRVKEEYKELIHETALHPEYGKKLLSVLMRSVGKHEGRVLWESAGNAAWESMEKRSCYIQTALIVRNIVYDPAAVVRRQLAQAGRFARRLLHPAGISIAIIGPDGAGKSTLIKGLCPMLDMTFKDKQHLVHWRPELIGPSSDHQQEAVIDPHGQAVRGRILSLMFFLYHTLMFVLGGWIKLAPLRFRGWVILLDRYYYDFFVDLRRFRLSLANYWVSLGYFFVPKPDIVLLLAAPPQVIRGRKQEVAEEETARQCTAYLDLIHRLDNGYILNADQPVSLIVDDALQIILDFLAQRSAHQWKKN